jgi:hypothetical protein
LSSYPDQTEASDFSLELGMAKPETITMSMQELDRLKMIQAVVSGQIQASTAAARLDLTRRQINQLIQRYIDVGASGLVSRKRGKPINFQLAPGLAASALAIIRERYQYFGPTLACEKLRELHGIAPCEDVVDLEIPSCAHVSLLLPARLPAMESRVTTKANQDIST